MLKKVSLVILAMCAGCSPTHAKSTVLAYAQSPESEGVSSRALLKWLDVSESQIDSLHGFVFLRHGKIIAEGSWKPFNTLNEVHRLSSHSKCFITTAIGLLIEGHKLDLDTRIVDILPDKIPQTPSEKLKALRVRDLLTMNLGSVSGNEEHWHDDVSGDWIKAILAAKLTKDPGLHYEYDSGATHLLGYVATRVSGMGVEEFLKQRLFSKIGIEKAVTTYDPCGNACAAWGFSMTTREISHIGQLYLNKGVWQGERIFSSDWADLATTKQTWTGKTPQDFQPKNDWTYGYGFNWWRCQHGCYRADGSGGQYTIVFPQQDAVLSIHADVNNMQQILTVVWDHFLPALANTTLKEDPATAQTLKQRCATLQLPTVAGKQDGGNAFLGKEFAIKGPVSIHSLRLDRAFSGWTLHLKAAGGEYDLPVGFREWEKSTVVISDKKYEALGDLVGQQRLAASAAVQDDDTIKVRLHVLGGPRRMDFHFRMKNFKPGVEGTMAGAGKFSM